MTWRLFFILVVSIFFSELLIMQMIAEFFPKITFGEAALLDSIVLTIITFPFLYFLLFRPLRIQISQRQEAETRLLEANHDLEHRVSERTRSLNTALAESEQSQEKIRCILNCITEALLVVDSQDKIALVNPLAEDLFEVEESRVLHKPLSCLFFDDTFSKKTEIAKNSGHAEVFEQLANGKHRWLHIKGAPLRNPDSESGGYVLLFEDVTKLRELEIMKGDFVSCVAHEINTPLTAIIGYGQLLLSEESELDLLQRKEALHYICEKAEDLSEILKNLLDLGRIEAQRSLDLQVEECDIVDLVRRAFRPYSLRTSLYHLDTHLPEEAVILRVDRVKIGQVLDNILNNAYKFSPAGGVVRVSGKKVGGEFLISIEDQGPGMPPEICERIFEKFFRANTSVAAPRGTGLGLSIARDIVELHGGRIWAESELDKGAAIYFALPC